MPWWLYLLEKNPWYPLNRKLGRPQSWSGHGSEDTNSQPLLGLENLFIQSVAQYIITQSGSYQISFYSRVRHCHLPLPPSSTSSTVCISLCYCTKRRRRRREQQICNMICCENCPLVQIIHIIPLLVFSLHADELLTNRISPGGQI
jgi:hypothetical protein